MKRSTIIECVLFTAAVLAGSLWIIYRDDAGAPRAQAREPIIDAVRPPHHWQPSPSRVTSTPSVVLPPQEAPARPKMTWNDHPFHKEARRGFEVWVEKYNITETQQVAAWEAVLDARDNYERGYRAFVEDASDVSFEMANGKPKMLEPAFTEEDFIRLQTGRQGREELFVRITEIAGEEAARGFDGLVGAYAGFFLLKPFVPVTE